MRILPTYPEPSLPEQLEIWRTKAEEAIRSSEEISLIDSGEIVDEWEAIHHWINHPQDLYEILEQFLSLDSRDISRRYVVLSFLMTLLQSNGEAVEDSHQGLREMFNFQVLRVNPEELDNPRQITWEIANAIATLRRDRVLELLAQLANTGTVDTLARLKLRVRMNIFLLHYDKHIDLSKPPARLKTLMPALSNSISVDDIARFPGTALLHKWGLNVSKLEDDSREYYETTHAICDDLQTIECKSKEAFYPGYELILAKCLLLSKGYAKLLGEDSPSPLLIEISKAVEAE